VRRAGGWDKKCVDLSERLVVEIRAKFLAMDVAVAVKRICKKCGILVFLM
jgi:hypothetical protein